MTDPRHWDDGLPGLDDAIYAGCAEALGGDCDDDEFDDDEYGVQGFFRAFMSLDRKIEDVLETAEKTSNEKRLSARQVFAQACGDEDQQGSGLGDPR